MTGLRESRKKDKKKKTKKEELRMKDRIKTKGHYCGAETKNF